MVKPIPNGYPHVVPYLFVPDTAKLIVFLRHTFGAVENGRRTMLPNGKVLHAEVRIGESPIMMGDAGEKFPAMPTAMYVYVEDTDAAYRRAIEAGATSMMEPSDQFFGDRNAGVKDPWGNVWWIATRVEDVPEEEMARRAAERGALSG
jgi:PhnB protein